MLILTRKLTETIVIGDEVKIVVLSINGSQVKLGIQAPTYIPVHREEIYDRIQREQEEKEETVE